MASYKHQRKLANFLLQPMVQLRIGAINVMLSLTFVLLLGAYVYMKFVQFVEVVTTLTEASDEVGTMLSEYLGKVALTGGVLALVFVLISLATSIYLTHRLVGPTVAFRRHIDALIGGDYKVNTKLRSHDAFVEVADSLNRLSEALQKK